MSTDTTKEVNKEEIPSGQESSPDDKKTSSDGSQPDIKAQMNDFKEEFNKKLKHSEDITKNMQNALIVERNKRKALQDKIGKKDEVPEFDPDEMANFKKAGKAAKFLTVDDLDQIQAKKSQEETIQKNTETFQNFITKNQAVFGSNDDATTEQEKNLKVFSSYLNEYFDVNKNTLANTKNLSKKLSKALKDLKGEDNVAVAESRGADKARAQNKNSVLLSIGADGGGSTTEDTNWKYGTPKADAAKLLKAQGYSDKEVKELMETATK